MKLILDRGDLDFDYFGCFDRLMFYFSLFRTLVDTSFDIRFPSFYRWLPNVKNWDSLNFDYRFAITTSLNFGVSYSFVNYFRFFSLLRCSNVRWSPLTFWLYFRQFASLLGMGLRGLRLGSCFCLIKMGLTETLRAMVIWY